MKKTTVAALITAALALSGCASMGYTVNRPKLIETASFDHDCPREKVKILSEKDGGASGTGNYKLNVCGEEKKYKRMGTMYFDAAKGSPLGG